MKVQFILLSLCLALQSCTEDAARQKTPLDQTTPENLLTGKFCLEQSPKIGAIGSVNIREGGFSGLYFIPNSEGKFYTINDRGPNLDLNHHPRAEKRNIKYFPFPEYAQKIHLLVITGDSLVMESSRPLQGTDNELFHGVNGLKNGEDELSWIDLNGTLAKRPQFFMDAEAITFQGDSILWVGEEYRPGLLKFNAKTLELISILSPIEEPGYQIPKLPNIFTKRAPNRGFEAIAFDGKKTIYAMLQSPLEITAADNTKLLRILEWNTETEESSFLVYEMGKQGYEQTNIDWKIGDMTAVNDSQFLVLEHGTYKEEKMVDIYLVGIAQASRFRNEPDFNGKRLEELSNLENAIKMGVLPVSKTHLIDLIQHGYDTKQGKPEGLTIINDSTIAVINDNDYGIEAGNSGEYIEATNINSCIYIYRLPNTFARLTFKKTGNE